MSEFMGDSDIMFADSGNFYHYAEQRGKTDPIPTDIPQDWKKLLGESTGQQFTSKYFTYNSRLHKIDLVVEILRLVVLILLILVRT